MFRLVNFIIYLTITILILAISTDSFYWDELPIGRVASIASLVLMLAFLLVKERKLFYLSGWILVTWILLNSAAVTFFLFRVPFVGSALYLFVVIGFASFMYDDKYYGFSKFSVLTGFFVTLSIDLIPLKSASDYLWYWVLPAACVLSIFTLTLLNRVKWLMLRFDAG